MNLIIVGQRGVGKTSAGRETAARVGAPFFDTDEDVEQAEGKSIHRIFEEEGEAPFRALEKKAILKIIHLDDHVISVGGGAPLDPGNRRILREAGRVVWLDASSETLLSRGIEGNLSPLTERPPLTDLPLEQEVVRLNRERRPVYAEVSQESINTDMMTLEEVIRELIGIWSTRRSSPPPP